MRKAKIILGTIGFLIVVTTNLAFKSKKAFGAGNIWYKVFNVCNFSLTCHTGTGSRACSIPPVASLFTQPFCPARGKWIGPVHQVIA